MTNSAHTNELESPLSLPEQAAQIIRILIVDDRQFFLELLQSYFEPEQDLEVVGSADNGKTALELVASLHPDLVIVDIEMPEIDGLMLTQAISQHFSQTKVMVLSSHDSKDYIRKALIAGAQGYLLKNTPAQELIHAIHFVYRGYLQLGPGLFEKLESNTLRSIAQQSLPTGNDLVEASTLPEPATADGTIVPLQTAQPIVANDGWSSVVQEQLDDLLAQLSTLKSEIVQTQKQIQSLTLQLEQRVVRSPTNGIIFQLPVKKAQTFVQPGQVVAQIAPQGLPLILKAQASSQQSGQMRVGMPVKLKFDAYPFQD